MDFATVGAISIAIFGKADLRRLGELVHAGGLCNCWCDFNRHIRKADHRRRGNESTQVDFATVGAISIAIFGKADLRRLGELVHAGDALRLKGVPKCGLCNRWRDFNRHIRQSRPSSAGGMSPRRWTLQPLARFQSRNTFPLSLVE